MHRIVDSQGGLYLDADALADAGFLPGRPVHIRFETGNLVLSSQPMVRLVERPASEAVVFPSASTG